MPSTCASVRWAADHCSALRELTAFAHPQNAASARVLQKAGFRPGRYLPEMNRVHHHLDLDERRSLIASAG